MILFFFTFSFSHSQRFSLTLSLSQSSSLIVLTLSLILHLSFSFKACTRVRFGLWSRHGDRRGFWILDWRGSMETGWFLGGDWWVANVTDDGSLKIIDDVLDAVWCWRCWWWRWSGGAVGQMVSPIWVLCGFCVCFAVRHGLIFFFWVQMGWIWHWSGGFFFFLFS